MRLTALNKPRLEELLGPTMQDCQHETSRRLLRNFPLQLGGLCAGKCTVVVADVAADERKVEGERKISF